VTKVNNTLNLSSTFADCFSPIVWWLFERAGSRNSNNSRFQFWQQHNQPIELNTHNKLETYLNYIHDNPVKAGFVLSPEDYLYSSSVNYAGRPETMLEVMLM
jgi:putative transposase